MNREEPTIDDVAAERALGLLEADPADPATLWSEIDAAECALTRQYLDSVSLLAWEVDPVPPSSDLKARLLGEVAGEETQLVPGMRGAGARPTARPAPEPSPVPAPVGRRPGPLLALAAALVLAAGLAGWLGLELRGERELRLAAAEETAVLRQALHEAQTARAAAEDAAEEAALRQRLALVTAVGTEVCPLRPPSPRAPIPGARALLYVAADHQHWYLKAYGLAPLPEGRVYQLWFVPEGAGTPVSGGTFRVGEEDEADLESPEMPAGTRAAFVTLEVEGPVVERPRGPVVLYGDEVMRLL